MFEEAQKVAREHLTKREREEVESLKARICELESQLKVKDTRWKSACDRLKETVDAQKKEILELKTANQQLERLRIEQLKKQARASSVNSSGSCSANNSLKRNNSKPVSFKFSGQINRGRFHRKVKYKLGPCVLLGGRDKTQSSNTILST